jgi:hypothetical protein
LSAKDKEFFYVLPRRKAMRTKCADWVCSFVVEKTLNETFKIKGETTNKKLDQRRKK